MLCSDYSEIHRQLNAPIYQLPSRASYEIKKGDILTSVSGNAIGTKKHASAIITERAL